MEDEKTDSLVVAVTILDTISLGRISAEIKGAGQVTIQLRHGRIKIRAGDDYLTGSFSSTKRECSNPLGQYKMWRECRFGELNIPEPGERNHIILNDIPYEMFISIANRDDDAEMAARKIYIDSADVIEKFIPHTCTCDCMPQCPAGVWIRE